MSDETLFKSSSTFSIPWLATNGCEIFSVLGANFELRLQRSDRTHSTCVYVLFTSLINDATSPLKRTDTGRSMNLCQVTFSEWNRPRVAANGRARDRRTVAVPLDFQPRRESLLSLTVAGFPETVNLSRKPVYSRYTVANKSFRRAIHYRVTLINSSQHLQHSLLYLTCCIISYYYYYYFQYFTIVVKRNSSNILIEFLCSLLIIVCL